MYLKSIEMCGFKSFADRTKLIFNSGITTIVGPNGCGKSNIVDAFRWCLGEQSAHSLRSQQMSSVIFGGSQTRAPSGFAEVSLTFDNSENMFPLNYAEITVTRKLFKSGESEYSINRTQCRMKDIRDLFLDTGIGTEGYSVFEQGRVEFVTNAKPDERRGLFEEAAGVAKYKVRREETLHKLDRVHQDMNRVGDMMSVIKEQIRLLESAVRKAKLYRKYQEELSVLELVEIIKKIISLDEELNPAEKSFEEKNNKFTETNSKFDMLDAELLKLRLQMTEYDEKLVELQKKMSQVDSEAARSEEKTENSKNMIRDFKQRKERLISETEKSGSNKVSIGESTGNLKVQIGELEKKVNELTEVTEKKASLLENIRDDISRSEQKVSQLKDELFKASAEKSRLNNELSKSNSQLAGLQTESAGQNRELTKLNEQKNSLGNEMSRLQGEITGLEEQSNAHRTDYEAVDKSCIEITEKLESLRTGLYADRERYITLTSKIKVQEELRQSDPKFRAVRTLIERQMPGIHGPISSIIKVSPYNTEVVNRTLGEKINYLISETLEHAVDAIEYLKENKLGQTGFIVLERIHDIPEKEFISRLKGEKPVISAVSYDSKWEKVVKFLFSNKYHAGDTVYHEGIVYGGSDGEDVQHPDLNTLKEEAGSLKEKLAENEENIKLTETSLKEQSARREEIDSTVKQFEVNIASLRKELDYKKNLVECAVKEINLVTDGIAGDSDKEREINSRISSSLEEISERGNLETSLRTEITALEDSMSALREHESRTNPEFTELKSSLSAYQERLQSCCRELEKSNENYVMFEDRVAELKQQIDELDSGVKEQTDIYNYETKHTDQLYGVRSGLEKEISDVQKEKTLLYDRIDKKDKEVQSLKHELDILRDRLHEIEVFCKTKQVEKTNYEKKLQEREIQFGEAKEKYGHIEPKPEEIDRLKRRIESMGAVNLTAEEQYTNLEERYKWIQTQQQDLLKAEEDLRQAITKINSAIRENFLETFEKVKNNFKELFCELFKGGEADLILTDQTNLLESGVEIVAQPPGKKLQNISLLSGGEKALTAIALLFSFFLVRPSPVCLLDEVDAPLDESNVLRFVNLIKSYSEKSQFVIITHNRRSIETADVIYGITMEEFGISKIISLQLVKPQTQTPRETLKTTVPA